MKRIQVIEALRGVAALAVVVFHITGQTHHLKSLGAYGWLGVEVFFVISGFVIPYSIWDRGYSLKQFPRYMMRRIFDLSRRISSASRSALASGNFRREHQDFRGSRQAILPSRLPTICCI